MPSSFVASVNMPLLYADVNLVHFYIALAMTGFCMYSVACIAL